MDVGLRGSTSIASFSRVDLILLQIALAVFKNEHEFGFGVDHIVQADYVDMLELIHQGDLPDGC